MKRIYIIVLLICLMGLTAVAQTISGIDPNKAYQGDSLTFSISGINTHFTQATSTVWFTQASSTINSAFVTAVNDTLLHAGFKFKETEPIGYYDLKINNAYDGSLKKSGALRLYSGESQIYNIVPNTAHQGEVLTLSISGVHTHFAQASNTVWFSQASSTISPSSIQVINNTTLNATFTFKKTDPIGYYKVNVHNTTDGLLEKTQGFLLNAYSPPQITYINPGSAFQGDSLLLSISGLNTHFAQASNTVWFNQASSTIPGYVYEADDTSLRVVFFFQVTDPLGHYNVNVTNTLDGLLQIPNGFLLKSLKPGTINTITPNQAKQGEQLTLSISGLNTHFTQASSTVWFGQASSTINPNYIEVINDTLINANFTFKKTNSVGYYNVYVRNVADGLLTKTNGFLLHPLPPPRIASISPGETYQGDSLTLTISGEFTHFTQATNTVWFTQASSTINPHSFEIFNDTTIRAIFKFSKTDSSGSYDINVSNAVDGFIKKSGAFLLKPCFPPLITMVTPNIAGLGDSLTVFVAGTHTHFTRSYNSIWLSQGNILIYPFLTKVINDSTLNVSFALTNVNPIGFYDLNISNTYDGLTKKVKTLLLIRRPPLVGDTAFSVYENVVNGFAIGKINAIDKNHEQLAYKILSGNNHNIFTIDKLTGEISVHDSANLDYERLNSHLLTIEVSDRESRVEVVVAIHVLDVVETSIEKHEADDFRIYPGVTNGIIFIDKNIQEDVQIWIFNSKGQIIDKKPFNNGQSQMSISLMGNEAGCYLIVIQRKRNIYTQKVILY